jgi:hypothetical protein
MGFDCAMPTCGCWRSCFSFCWRGCGDGEEEGKLVVPTKAGRDVLRTQVGITPVSSECFCVDGATSLHSLFPFPSFAALCVRFTLGLLSSLKDSPPQMCIRGVRSCSPNFLFIVSRFFLFLFFVVCADVPGDGRNGAFCCFVFSIHRPLLPQKKSSKTAEGVAEQRHDFLHFSFSLSTLS